MHASLRPAQQALRDLFPDADQVDATMGMTDLDKAKALVVEGDLALSHKGLLQTDQLLPDILAGLADGESLVAIVVTGDLIAPETVLMEPDYDWSPRFKIGGMLHVKSLCLGGSASLVMRDLIAEDTVFGFYNHGRLQVGGRTTAKVILAADYEMEFAGAVTCPHVLSWDGRLNIPASYQRDQLHLALDPEVVELSNLPRDAEIITRLVQGESILRPEQEIGKPLKRTLSKRAKERFDAIAKSEADGEAIINVDLSECDLRFVPEEIRRFDDLRFLNLSKNAVSELPPWIADFARLEALELRDCELASIPSALAHHPRLRRLILDHNEITGMPAGPYTALEHLRVGRGYDDDHINFLVNLDLSRFPALRYAELPYGNLPRLQFAAKADLWDCPSLEYLEIGAVIDGGLPRGLAKAKRLKGFACSLPPSSVTSARALKQQWPDLEVLSLGYGGLSGDEVASIAAALPGVYVRVDSCRDFDLDLDHPLYRINSRIGTLLNQQSYDEAAAEAEALLPELTLSRPRFEAGFIEEALRHCLDAFMYDAAQAEGDAKAAKVVRAADLADRVLTVLPKTPVLSWLLHQRDLGLLRLSCQIAQALIHFNGPVLNKTAAIRILDTAQLEVDAYMDKSNTWFVDRAGWIRTLRERVLTET